MTKREAIIQAITTNLGTIPALSGKVFRSRPYALTRAESPAVLIETVSDSPDATMVGVYDWTLVLRIAVITRGSDVTDAADGLADTHVESIHSKLSEDLSLGGLSMDIRPSSVNFEVLDGDMPSGVLSLGYQVVYRTQATDLTQ